MLDNCATGSRANSAHWSIAKVYLINALFGTVIALVIWMVIPGPDNPGFINNWVHAQAIGTLICSLVLFTNYCKSRFKVLPSRLLLFVLPIIIVVGFYGGTTLARLVLQLPAASIHSYSDKHLLIVSMALTVAVTVVITWFFTTQNTIAQLRITAAEESERATQAHLSMLLAQIEPHMLFNTLANLRALITSEPEKARDMLDLLIDFLRTALSHSRAPSITLDSEFQMIETYLELMSLRLGDRLTYRLYLPAELGSCSIPSLLLQPIVENAIKHGVEPSITGGNILVKAIANENLLTLTVEDTGVGLSVTQQGDSSTHPDSKDHGFGMSNAQTRCTALPGGNFELVSPLPGLSTGTLVKIQLPLQRMVPPGIQQNHD